MLLVGVLWLGAPASAQTVPSGGSQPLPLSGAAYRVAQQGYDAYQRHDYAAAETHAREAIRQRPDLASLRLLLANAQAAQRRYSDASRTLNDAIRQLGPDAALVARRRAVDAQIAGATSARKGGNGRTAGRTVGRTAVVAGAGSPDQLTGRAYLAAQRAYKAYADKDYEGALNAVNEAVSLRPDVLRLRLLAIDAANAAGDLDAAWQEDLDAVQRFGDNDALRGRRLLIGARLAPKPGGAALAAYQGGAYAEAATLAREAIGYAPDKAGYRMQLLAALLAQNDLPGAEQAATEAIDAGIQPAATFHVLRGYARAAQGRAMDADADFAQALQGSADTAANAANAANAGSERDARITRAIVADVWTAEGEPQRALDLLAPLKPAGDDTDTLIDARRFEARQKLASAATGQASAEPSLQVANAARPILDCITDAYGSSCYVYPADPGFAARRASILAAQRGDKAAALAHAREAVAAAPRNAQHRVELINALDDAGDHRGAQQEARAALHDGLLDALLPLQAAYIAQRAGNDRRAFAYFAQADEAGQLPARASGDAGYSAYRAWFNEAAARYIERAIDYGTAPPDGAAPATQQQLQDLRNVHADATRTWGFTTSLNYRGAGLQPGVASGSAPGTYNNWQAGLEGYWRPFGALGDRMFEVYARAYDDFAAKGNVPSGISTALGAVGVRAKPFESVDAIVAFERLIPLGSRAPEDWLLRLAYSGGLGTERRLDVPSWWTVQDYAEVGHYVSHGWNYGTGYVEAGRTYRLDQISPKLTVFPYGVIGADYDSSINHQIPLGMGVGVSTRYWFRDSFYDSPRSFVDVSVQYRWRITGDNRAGGVFFGAVLSY
ncbi:NfrA family protein [Paraburkholderia phenazinium]|nr:tetratricopeptide repeat protein [Paraburkholderia phenazinium]